MHSITRQRQKSTKKLLVRHTVKRRAHRGRGAGDKGSTRPARVAAEVLCEKGLRTAYVRLREGQQQGLGRVATGATQGRATTGCTGACARTSQGLRVRLRRD